MPDSLLHDCSGGKFYEKYTKCECECLGIDKNELIYKYKRNIEFDGKYHQWTATIYQNKYSAIQFVKFYNYRIIDFNDDIINFDILYAESCFLGFIICSCKNCNLTMPISTTTDNNFNLKFDENDYRWRVLSWLEHEYNHVNHVTDLPNTSCNDIILNNILK